MRQPLSWTRCWGAAVLGRRVGECWVGERWKALDALDAAGWAELAANLRSRWQTMGKEYVAQQGAAQLWNAACGSSLEAAQIGKLRTQPAPMADQYAAASSAAVGSSQQTAWALWSASSAS